MKKIKAFLAFAIAVSMCVSTAACGKTDGGEKDDAEEKVTTTEAAAEEESEGDAEVTTTTTAATTTTVETTAEPEPEPVDTVHEERYGYYELLKTEWEEYGDTSLYKSMDNETTMMKNGEGIIILNNTDPIDPIKIVWFDKTGKFEVLAEAEDEYSIMLRSGNIYTWSYTYNNGIEVGYVNIFDGTSGIYTNKEDFLGDSPFERTMRVSNISANGDVLLYDEHTTYCQFYKLSSDLTSMSGPYYSFKTADGSVTIDPEDLKLSTMSYGSNIYLKNKPYYLDCDTMELVKVDSPESLEDREIRCVGKYAFVCDDFFHSAGLYDMEKNEYNHDLFPSSDDLSEIWRANIGSTTLDAMSGFDCVFDNYGGGYSHIMTDSEGVWRRVQIPAVIYKDESTDTIEFVDDCLLETLGKQTNSRWCKVVDDEHYIYVEEHMAAYRSFEKGESENIDTIEY